MSGFTVHAVHTERNFCTGCRRDFASLAAFDRHRIGSYPQRGPADYLDRIGVGLADPLEDYDPRRHGRRCLEDDELAEAGMERDSRGRWRLAGDAERIRAFREAA
jgi:hypothetical protein